MRQRSRLLAVLLGVLLTVPMLVLRPATPAQADPIPPTDYPPVTISDIPQVRHLVTDVYGNVTVGCSVGTATNAAKTFDPSGSVVQTVATGSTWREFCDWDSAVGVDGTVFVSADPNSYTHQIQAWKNGSMVWEYTIPCGAYTAPIATAIGTDGNFYFVAKECSGYQRLIGLTPTAQSGTTAPSVVLNEQISGTVHYNGLSAYDGGLVLHKGNAIQYVTYLGTVGNPISLPNVSTSNIQGVERWFESSTDGRVFTVNKADANDVIGCPNTDMTAASITALTPSGTSWTAYLGTGCHYVQEVHPLPNGGFVARVGYQTVAQGSYNPTPRLVAFDGNGDQIWMQSFEATSLDLPRNDLSFAVDLNGNVAVRANVEVGKYINGSYWKFPEIRFVLLSGVTGDAIAETSLALRGDSNTTSGPSHMFESSEVAIAKDTAYIVAHQCTTGNSCDPSTTKLYAFSVPGLHMDYPRGAILKHYDPWLSYVAMGDSFSSGQGVTPYEAGTDTAGPPENRCRRSESAYAHLLDGLYGPRIYLTDFVACGGSETTHVINGKDGEPPQIDALSMDTDVVTITVGGNDIGFTEFGSDCFWGSCEGTSYGDVINEIEDTLPGRLDILFEEIESKIGVETRVLVIGYPLFIPDPSINTLPYCGYLTSDEKAAARDVITRLDQELDNAVTRAVNDGADQFEYVDPNTATSPFAGHELCQEGSYFNGVVLPPNDTFSFHPTAAGHDAYRLLVQTHLAN